MKRIIKALLLVLLLADTVLCSMLRLVQLLRYTDAETGLVVADNSLSYIIYFLIIAAFIIGCVFAFGIKDKLIVTVEGNRTLFAASICMSLLFFYDFVRQCLNCYRYFDRAILIEYNALIPLVLSTVLSLVCSFYMLIIALSSRGSGYDFRSFRLLHFSVLLWAFSRLIMIMVRILDIAHGVESVCEFIMLVMISLFALSVISAIDKGTGEVTRELIIFGLSSFSTSFVLSFPRAVTVLSGRGKLLYDSGFSVLTYFGLSLFILSIVLKSIKTKKD